MLAHFLDSNPCFNFGVNFFSALLATSAEVAFARRNRCASIAEIACDSDNFSTLCLAINAAGLYETLHGPGLFTLFAPTDQAFENLPEGTLDGLLQDIPALTDILEFHTVPSKVTSRGLKCSRGIPMFNGQKSHTVCRKGKVFQKGRGNSDNTLPQIIDFNMRACNGVVHMVSEVMLPSPQKRKTPKKECISITDIACTTGGFDTLCKAVLATGLDKVLDGPGMYTVFAPTDEAFGNLPEGTVEALLEDIPALSDLLRFHAVSGKVYSTDLECTSLVHMLNGNDTRTVCRNQNTFQTGAGNSDYQMPQFIDVDRETCNGVVHVLDEVMLPPPDSDDKCHSISEIACNTYGFKVLCEALEVSGLKEVLDGSDKYTIFAPTDDAFNNLPPGVVVDENGLKDLLLLHSVAGEIPSWKLQCTRLVHMANGQDTRTVCQDEKINQKGAGNADDQKPEIIDMDIKACNGIVHVVNQVILPP